MKTTRRGFLAGMLALGAAPAIVKASSLMKLATPPKIIVPDWQLMVQPMYPHVQELVILSRFGQDFDGDTVSFSTAKIANGFQLTLLGDSRVKNLPIDKARVLFDNADLECRNETSDLVWRPKLNRIIVGNSLGSKRVL